MADTCALSGIRVVEVGRFAAGPACATVLADWGADVVKIEPPGGDPARGPGSVGSANPRFEVHNRSRRSVCLDLRTAAGRQAADTLLARSDVLVTNLSPDALTRLRLDADTVRADHPRLVHAQVSGYDPGTPQARDRSYDHGGYWSFSGVASLFAGPDGEPAQPTGGFGDRAAGTMLAGAVAAALLARERTGQGAAVRTSLVNTGYWLAASDVGDVLATGREQRRPGRAHAPIPTVNSFRAGDGRWLWLQVMHPDQEWPELLKALDADWLDEDPRFRGGDPARLKAARGPLLELLDEIFRGRPAAEWLDRLRAHRIVAAPVRTLAEAVTDPDTRASSAVVELPDQRVSVNTPVTFSGLGTRPPTRAPETGEHTEAVLAEAGFSAADIDRLRTSGAFGGGPHGSTAG